MKFNTTLLVVVISATLLVACGSDEEELTDGTQNTEAGINDASTNGLNNGSGVSGSELSNGFGRNGGNGGLGPEFSDPSNPLSKQTIYFQLDSSQVQQDFISVIAAHAQYLAANPGQHLTLEGHGDERGSREYNIALGEQRAKSVANMMKLQGVGENQLEVVSYGEEKPAAFGHDEDSWQLNRRVELVYQGK
ncbi:MAG: peptidoglycan-associated lipoprotein Pal [Methylococcaceae bacterium]|jgi:peptidoglycan-associated lipoprotein